MVYIQTSSFGELRYVEFDAKRSRIYIFVGDACIGFSPDDAIALRDKLADALTQAAIQRDAQQAAA